MAGGIVPLFLKAFATHGDGLGLELVAVIAGVVAGLCAARLTHGYLSPRTGRPVSRTGVGYAALWIGVIGARAAFSYGSEHWFSSQLGHWMMHHHVTVDALTDSLLLMAQPTQTIIGDPAFEANDVKQELAALQLTHGVANLTSALQTIEQTLAEAEKKHGVLPQRRIAVEADRRVRRRVGAGGLDQHLIADGQ